MRWSQMHIPTLRTDPAGADAPSHRLLLRAGYVRQLMAGHYSLLPLAVRVRSKIIDIIREEMGRIGAQECFLPAMHPRELWERSGRWEIMGDELFRLRDRKGADLALGVTHEEIFGTLASELSSYRSLPQRWYQFQTKFRDEPRPKAGLMRTREFTMKDSYSFDLDAEGLDVSFDLHRDAYVRIFRRLGIPAILVDASSGSMGGSASTEFVCLSETGEDLIVYCPSCGYAANIEKATSRLAEPADETDPAALERFDTPGVRTIEDLATGYGAAGSRQIKTLVYVLGGAITLVLLRGDHALNEQKLADTTGAVNLRLAHPEETQEALGALPGSLGAVGVTNLPIIADETLRGRRNMFTGANTDDVHFRGVDVGRDITVGTWADLREVSAGEPCDRCESPLRIQKGIEVGHIFKLGYRYADALGIEVLDDKGRRAKVIMGSYGIGVERAMAAIIETHHDDKGIVWPVSVAPFQVALVVAQSDDAETVAVGEDLYAKLAAAGVEVIIDDRSGRPGAKFRDVELTGIPYRLTVGKHGLAAGTVEVTTRETGETVDIPVGEAINYVTKVLAAAGWVSSR
jgi:prolyl-tRNA synthetase